jgi:hypothetical protein
METTQNTVQEGVIRVQHATVPPEEQGGSSKRILIIVIVAAILLVALLVAAVWGLLQPTTDTARIRDVFIIGMALMSLLIGVTLVILIIQMARLINLLQNEIKPILDSTNETVANLRGTTAFLSDNLVEPVIKLNEMSAALYQVVRLLGLARRKP